MLNKKKILPRQYGNAELKKSDRLRLESEFNNLKEVGRKYIGKYFILVTAENINELKFGIICSRKFSKNAVVRNRARRLLKESFRLIKNRIEFAHIIFIPRQKIKTAAVKPRGKKLIYLY